MKDASSKRSRVMEGGVANASVTDAITHDPAHRRIGADERPRSQPVCEENSGGESMTSEQFEANLKAALTMVENELRRAYEIHGDFRSMHEGYAVILEELDELWDEVKKKGAERDREQLTTESKQVAAMGVKFLMFMLKDGRHR